MKIFFSVLAGMALLLYGARSMTEVIGQAGNHYARQCFLHVARFPAIAYPISLVMFAALLAVCWPNPTMQVGMAHLGFNVLLTCCCVPLASPLTWLLTSLMPSGEKVSVRHISESTSYPRPSPVADG
ncbi:hypothetical protein KSC_108770 [Ktedonobacter sp. SOSP1-52]|uniref:hypothetical protein n=1 Tax=Ktedonobacter sp. SOSP1-52 TaxID=2778366 RepID=UPI001A1BEE40|nr:hypothetical protein [Ktedonobacter sp. SOSP1-52]GHO71985.1 hypothetical protein KSC_108770 [Ktedonobacter sp. SOSP1-52]